MPRPGLLADALLYTGLVPNSRNFVSGKRHG
jgi:hypothetical protein